MAPRSALPKELSDFLIELSIALHKHAMYPGGHPTLGPAAESVAARLGSLLSDRGTLSLGVARDQLVIEGVATDPKNPVLQDLAGRLHRHHLGAVSFTSGVSWEELEEALKMLAVDADRGDGPIGLRPMARIATWPHLRLFPITFDRLALVGDDGDGDVTGGRAAQLWVGLARAALAAEDLKAKEKVHEPNAFRLGAEAPPPPPGEVAAEPSEVATAIESHERGTAYDQVIVGYLLQIAEELKAAGDVGAAALKRKMSRLVSALDPRTLERLLDMGGDLAQRKQFMLDAAQGMAVDAVVDLVQAAHGTGAPISGAMIRMLTKLGHHAERGPAPRRVIAESSLREQVAELVHGWNLADPNPGGYALALQKMAQAAPNLVAASEVAYAPEPLRIVQMAVEAEATGERLRRAVDDLTVAGGLGHLLTIVGAAPGGNAAAAMIRERIVVPEALRALLGVSPVDFGLIDQLSQALGEGAIVPMLDVLAESESRQVRRGIIDRLIKVGDPIGPMLVARLGDERWYVLRNLLYLGAEIPHAPVELDASRYRQHADARVRREAMRLLFRHPVERTRAICTALTDEDPRTKRLALSSVGSEGWPEAAVPLLVTLAADEEQDEDLRVSAIRALAAQGGRLALEALLKMTEIKRRTLIGAMMQQGATATYLAALAGLAGFAGDARVKDRLGQIAKGRDPAAAKAAADILKGAR